MQRNRKERKGMEFNLTFLLPLFSSRKFRWQIMWTRRRGGQLQYSTARRSTAPGISTPSLDQILRDCSKLKLVRSFSLAYFWYYFNFLFCPVLFTAHSMESYVVHWWGQYIDNCFYYKLVLMLIAVVVLLVLTSSSCIVLWKSERRRRGGTLRHSDRERERETERELSSHIFC